LKTVGITAALIDATHRPSHLRQAIFGPSKWPV